MFVRFLFTLAMAANFASAQGGHGGSEGGMGGEGATGGGMPRVQRQSKQDLLFDKLKLSKEQKQQAQQILSTTMQKSATARDLVTKGRQIIATALIEKRSDDEIKRLFNEYTTVSAQMTSFEAEAFGKIYAILKPNQQSKAPQAFELMAGMFAGGGRGGEGQGRGEGRRNGGR